MHLDLSVIPLDGERLVQVLPLVQTVRPELTLERLQEILQTKSTRDVADPPAEGIVALENMHGYIVSLFSYAVVNEPIDGRMLLVNHVVVMDVFGRYEPQGTMMREMEKLAEQHDCGLLQVNLADSKPCFPRQVGALVRYFQEAGHAFDGVRLRKRLSGAVATNR